MGDDPRLQALMRIYALYEDHLRGRRIACRRRCRHCCTTRVTVTTLEARAILEALSPGERARLRGVLEEASGLPRRRPGITLNGLAALWAEGLEEPSPSEEEEGSAACPLLADDLCSIYAVRPFHCRCLVSQTACTAGGAAEMEEGLLLANTVFLQAIEHLDAGGFSGNLLDVLAALLAAGEGGLSPGGAPGLIANRPLGRLLLPPGQRAALEPVLSALRRIRL